MNIFGGEKAMEIVMLGNTSVGKTSMLSALSKNIKQINNVCGVSFSPYGDSIMTLDDAWTDMTDEITRGGVYQPLVAALQGSTDFVDYHFNVCFKGEPKPRLILSTLRGRSSETWTDRDSSKGRWRLLVLFALLMRQS